MEKPETIEYADFSARACLRFWGGTDEKNRPVDGWNAMLEPRALIDCEGKINEFVLAAEKLTITFNKDHLDPRSLSAKLLGKIAKENVIALISLKPHAARFFLKLNMRETKNQDSASSLNQSRQNEKIFA